MKLKQTKVRDGFLVKTEYKEVAETFNAKEGAKEDTLSRLTVTVSSGKTFYADQPSRIDLRDAIAMGEELGQTSTMWKLAEEFEGQRIVMVTIQELKEASMMALQAKGGLVGV